MSAVLKLEFPTRATVAVAAATLALIVAATWFLVVGPRRSQAARLDRQIATQELALSSLRRASSSAVVAQKKAELRSSARAMPSTTAMPGIVVQLNRLARRAGVTLDAISPTTTTPVGAYQAVGITVVLEGRYAQVQSFLRRLRTQVRVGKDNVQAAGRLFDVQKVNLEQTEPAPNLTVTLNVQAFVFAPAAAASVAPVAVATSDTSAPGS